MTPPFNTKPRVPQRASPEEVLEEHQQPVGRREDAVLAGAGVRAALLQADAALRHGRDRRGARLQERLHRRELHQGEQERKDDRDGEARDLLI